MEIDHPEIETRGPALAYATPTVAARRDRCWLRFTFGAALVLVPAIFGALWSRRTNVLDVTLLTTNLLFDAGVVAGLFHLGLRWRRRRAGLLIERHWAMTCCGGLAAIIVPIALLILLGSLAHPSNRVLAFVLVELFAAFTVTSPWWVLRRVLRPDLVNDDHDRYAPADRG